MNTEKNEKIITEIKTSTYDKGDLSDIGNNLGYIIGKYISNDIGYEKDDFLRGILHGISISDGTHP